MSLTYTAVKCNDGKWYKEPCWRGADYFICTDDDEPIEIVIKKPKYLTPAMALDIATLKLQELGITALIDVNSYFGGASRYFPKEFDRKDMDFKAFHKAFRFFIRVTTAPPPPNVFDKVQDKPFNDGCKYEWDAQAVPVASEPG